MNIQDLTAAQLKHAADVKEKIDALEAELTELLGSSDSVQTLGKRGAKKGWMSAAGRARIAEAQRKRWAKLKVDNEEAESEKRAKKHKMSAAGRAAIVAAQKARWQKNRAGKKS